MLRHRALLGGRRSPRAVPALGWRKAVLLCVLALAIVTALRSPTLVNPLFNPDEASVAVQAHVLRDGGRLYHDVADRKPPVVPYLYAAVFALRGHDDLIAIHVLAIFWMAATALVIGWLMRRRAGDTAALWAAGLFLAASVCYPPSETQAANFEIFMLLPTCLAMGLAGRGRPTLDLAAGVALAVAALCKQQAGITLVPALFVVWRERRRVAGACALLGGFLATVGATALYFGPSEFYFWNISSNGHYLSVAGILGYAAHRFGVMTGSFILANVALCWLLLRSARMRAREDLDLWLWLGASAIGVAAGLRFFGHYYLQLLPPMALLAAPAAAALSARGRTWLAGAVAVPAIALALAGFFSARLHSMPDYRHLASYIKSQTAPTDRIAVWGHFPEVYWASGRMPAARLMHMDFMTGTSGGRPVGEGTEQWATPGAWETLFEDFARHPPKLFIDTSPAGIRDYDQYPISHYPRLQAYLAAHFRETAEVDGSLVYVRSEGNEPGEEPAAARVKGTLRAAVHF